MVRHPPFVGYNGGCVRAPLGQPDMAGLKYDIQMALFN
jgi:hypothetical protein